MKAMVLAAGEGTRLRPLTLNMPKPMVPVRERPALEYIVAWLSYHGIKQIAMNLHHCPDVIPDHFGDGSDFGVQLTYSRETKILGTAGGAKKLSAFLDSPFVLVYGDVLTDLNLTDMLEAHANRPAGTRLTMSLYHVPNPTECGIVRLDESGRVREFVEKPEENQVFSDLASAGILIVEPKILDLVPEGTHFDFGNDVFPRLLADDVPVYGWVLPETAYLLDIGSHEKHEFAQQTWPTQMAERTFWRPETQ